MTLLSSDGPLLLLECNYSWVEQFPYVTPVDWDTLANSCDRIKISLYYSKAGTGCSWGWGYWCVFLYFMAHLPANRWLYFISCRFMFFVFFFGMWGKGKESVVKNLLSDSELIRFFFFFWLLLEFVNQMHLLNKFNYLSLSFSLVFSFSLSPNMKHISSFSGMLGMFGNATCWSGSLSSKHFCHPSPRSWIIRCSNSKSVSLVYQVTACVNWNTRNGIKPVLVIVMSLKKKSTGWRDSIPHTRY